MAATLQTDRQTMIGKWHNMDHCPSGMYTNGLSIKYHPNQGPKGDNSALTGLHLFCNSPTSSVCSISNPIESTVAYGGAWQSVQWCSTGQAFVGFSFRQTYYSPTLDNTGVVNFAGYCGYPFGERTTARRNTDKWGTWSKDKFCPVGYVICGFQTQVDAYVAKRDNQGVTNFNVECCEVSDIPCTPGHQILTLTKLDNSHGKKVASLSYDVKTSFTITSEYRTPSYTENKIISQKLAYNVEALAYRINTEIGNSGNHVTSSSLRVMLQDAMGQASTRNFKVQVPRKKQAVVKQVYLTCGAYRVALAHVIEEGTKKPGHGGGNDKDNDDRTDDDC